MFYNLCANGVLIGVTAFAMFLLEHHLLPYILWILFIIVFALFWGYLAYSYKEKEKEYNQKINPFRMCLAVLKSYDMNAKFKTKSNEYFKKSSNIYYWFKSLTSFIIGTIIVGSGCLFVLYLPYYLAKNNISFWWIIGPLLFYLFLYILTLLAKDICAEEKRNKK